METPPPPLFVNCNIGNVIYLSNSNSATMHKKFKYKLTLINDQVGERCKSYNHLKCKYWLSAAGKANPLATVQQT